MEMFNKKELQGRIGPLKKSKSLYDLEQVEGYVIRRASELGLETSYDVMAEEMPYFKTLAYTEYAGCFYLQPLNFKLRNEQMQEAWHDSDSEIVDYHSWFVDKVVNNNNNKYTDREDVSNKYPAKNAIVVLPGSNKVRENVCLNKLKWIKQKYGDNVYFKPHPITTHQIIGELKDFFGEDCILPRDADMYYFLQKANEVYTTHISESCLYAVALGKPTQPIDVWNNIQRGSFYCINNYLMYHQVSGKDYINKTFSSYKSGIINPAVDKDWRKKVDAYLDWIYLRRECYKNWFLADEPKKK
jgi:hypothetical protein|tara:strand:- start:2158 stop:3057 length:900 start_codon:yes stop_codon:yes gene_type:complete